MSDTANSDKNTDGLKPWEPGKSGNPSGRPKIPEHILKALRGPLTDLSIKVIRGVLDGSEQGTKVADKIKAAEFVFDRGFGKAVQTIEADVNTTLKPLDTSKLNTAQKDALAALAVANMGTDDE